MFVVYIIINFLIWGFTLYLLNRILKQSKKEKQIEFKEEIPYFREIPTKDLKVVFYLGTKFGFIKDYFDFFNAFLLKWILEDKITLEKKEDKIYFNFSNHFSLDDEIERKIYHFFLASAKENALLEEKELLKYILYHKPDLEKLVSSMLEKVEKELYEQEKIRTESVKKATDLSDEYYILAREILGLKKYLEDFSLIEEKNVNETMIWEYHLIYAQIFGMTSKIEKELKSISLSNHTINELKNRDSSIISDILLVLKLKK